MCRGATLRCGRCGNSTRVVDEPCIRAEVMFQCPEIFYEGVQNGDDCRMCRNALAKGKIIMPPSVLALADNYDRDTRGNDQRRFIPRRRDGSQRLKRRHSWHGLLNEGEEDRFWGWLGRKLAGVYNASPEIEALNLQEYGSAVKPVDSGEADHEQDSGNEWVMVSSQELESEASWEGLADRKDKET
ncbi:hypothetical protein FZEAL_9541 [Fusarium zealandicum]|uniref:Uncharacterized protein n=1 Tax=Fusarium zealandicum TaxID=1053134 RepID=A0A8H4UAZ4_9HYPO|nr:hypothetical protein FZEAL_9541 [Fusarium zealandicum]